jgi:type I pantothenate kinase
MVQPASLRPGGEASAGTADPSVYQTFSRMAWAELRANTPLLLGEQDLAALRSLHEPVGLDEVADIYLPLSRLLNLHVNAARSLIRVTDAFLGRPAAASPYVVAIAGSVAVGKSTFARVLQALMARWPDHPSVALVTTDGFLHPNRILSERGLMARKGFPESYDLRRMIRFLADVKSGAPVVTAPVYSHLSYDIVPGRMQVVERPDVLIFEGLNVLQTAPAAVVASDFFDFSVYIDADENDIERWYLDRFLSLQRTAFQSEQSFFHHYKDLTEADARDAGRRIWRSINRANLHENIQPTRPRARVVLRKGASHAVNEVWLRQV